MKLEVKETDVIEKLGKVKEKRFVLELTEEEAFYIKAFTGMIGGPTSGPRGITDRLYYELCKHIKQSTTGTFNTDCLIFRKGYNE